jgi:hypothetical protein
MDRKLFLTLLILASPALAHAGQTTLHTTTYACRVDSENPEEVLVQVLGTLSLQLGTDDAATDAMTCLLKLWPNADGVVGEDMPNALLVVMEENPEVFFTFMSKSPEIFRKWLEQLPDLSFTWYKNPPCLLEPKREQLISLLEHTKMTDPKLESLKEEVITKLKSIRCRQID